MDHPRLVDPVHLVAAATAEPPPKLGHLGLPLPEQDKPPPPREILRVAEKGDGWGVPASRD